VVNRTAELLGLFDVFVLPSLSEGLGLSLMEAQSAGLPVVASAVGGVLDIVENEVTGYLVPPADSGALAGAITKVLSDPEAALETGRRARNFILSRYSVRQMVEGTLNAYQAVI
jgi:glycosyltransferase involved in cell wall biosynthesis